MNFDGIHSMSSISAARTAPSESASPYSIQFLLDWHCKAFQDLVAWSMENFASLLKSAVWLLITIVVSLVLLLLIRKAVVPCLRKKHGNIAKGLTAVSSSVAWLVFWIGFSGSIHFVPFSAEVHKTIDTLFYVFFTLTVLRIFQHALRCTTSLLIDRFKRRDPENYVMNKLMLDFCHSILRLCAWGLVIIFICQEVFHLNVTHLIASAGILGLAIAFAAKDTISNVFGAFFILSGKMFRVGDWIKTGSTEGIVERIGFRSIQIRALTDGRLIDIPNHIIADSQIENFSKRLFWREHFSYGLVYQSTPEQIELAKKIVCDVGKDLAGYMAEDKPVQFDLLLLDSSSVNLEGYVWFKSSDSLAMRHARGLFNEEILKRFNAAGIEIAFPTTTVFVENPEKK